MIDAGGLDRASNFGPGDKLTQGLDARAEFLRDAGDERAVAEPVAPVLTDDDPFAGVRDLGDDDE